jgi:hypothetical protein
MAYTPSLREIPLDQEPHASVIAAAEESPGGLANLDDAQKAHLDICPQCRDYLGGLAVGNYGQAGTVELGGGA